MAFNTLTFWTTERRPDSVALLQQIASDFTRQSGHRVEVVSVPEHELNVRLTAAFAADDLPDVVYHPMAQLRSWLEEGMINPEASRQVVQQLGVDTFAQGALNLSTVRGELSAVPADGWSLLLLYRKDLFDEKGLEPPNSYQNIQKALLSVHKPPFMNGFAVATKADDVFMSQVLEYLLSANGISPVSDRRVQLLDLATARESFVLYKSTAEASPPGKIYWRQARDFYFSGSVAMTIWSSAILDELAGLRGSALPDFDDNVLATKTGVVTRLSGPSNPEGAAWAKLHYLSITVDAQLPAAQAFVRFLMGPAYPKLLSLAPEVKLPTRYGSARHPARYLQAWKQLRVGVGQQRPLSAVYSDEVLNSIGRSLQAAQRWGVSEGQRDLAIKVFESQMFNRTMSEYIDGELSVDQAIEALNTELSRY